MPIYYQRILAFFLSCFVSLAWAADANSEWYKLDSNNQVILKVEMFLSSTCPHCQKADAYFKSIEPQNKWLEVNRHYIDKDKNALETFSQYLNQQNSTNFSVPAILFCNTRWVGFSEADNSGKAILQGLELCRRQIEKRGVLTANTISILDTMATTSMMEASLEEGTSASPQVLLPLMALIDALNPCASIMVMLLFAFLIVNKEQRLLTAVLFLLPVGLIHLIQQSQTVYFYSLLPWLRVPAIALGVALSAFVYYLYERRNLRVLVFLGISFFTALAAQVYQQGCWPNLSLIFKQWLEAQDYSNMKQHLFLLAYNTLYLLFLGLFGVLTYAITRMKRAQRYAQFIEYFACAFLLLTALTLIVYPYAIGSAIYMVVAVILAVILAQGLKYYKRRTN